MLYSAKSKTTGLLLILLLMMTAFSSVHASKPAIAPETIDGVTRVDAEGLIEKVAEIPDLVVIDARIRSDRSQGHIEGSISLPDKETTCDSLEGYIPDHSTPVLFYCNGPRCGRSVISSQIAVKCGYRSIYWFRGGIEEWQKKQYPLIKGSVK